MPIVQTAIVKEIPAQFLGRAYPVPTSGTMRPTCDASEIPALAAEGVTGPVRIMAVSSHGTRRHADGRPMLLEVRFCCVAEDGALPEVTP